MKVLKGRVSKKGKRRKRQDWVHLALERAAWRKSDIFNYKQGGVGAGELFFISTEVRTKGNEFKLQQEGLKLDIKGKNLPDEKTGEIMEHIIERAVEAYPWRCLRMNIYLFREILETQWPGVLEWRLLDLSLSPKILLLYLMRQTVQWYMP